MSADATGLPPLPVGFEDYKPITTVIGRFHTNIQTQTALNQTQAVVRIWPKGENRWNVEALCYFSNPQDDMLDMSVSKCNIDNEHLREAVTWATGMVQPVMDAWWRAR